MGWSERASLTAARLAAKRKLIAFEYAAGAGASQPTKPAVGEAGSLALVLLGAQLERHWTRGQLCFFCIISATGAGLTHIFLSSLLMVGAAPVMFGLLIAWAFECGHQPAQFPLFGEMTVRQMVLIFAGISLAIMFFSAGIARTLVMAAGGLTGWLYLWLRHKWLMSRSGRAVESSRINRLEL